MAPAAPGSRTVQSQGFVLFGFLLWITFLYPHALPWLRTSFSPSARAASTAALAATIAAAARAAAVAAALAGSARDFRIFVERLAAAAARAAEAADSSSWRRALCAAAPASSTTTSWVSICRSRNKERTRFGYIASLCAFVGPRCVFVCVCVCWCVYSRVGASYVGRPICVCAVSAPLRRVNTHNQCSVLKSVIYSSL